MNAQELVLRSRSAIGQKTKYKLGAGGTNPKSALPHNLNKECDCSGFVSWGIGISRVSTHPFYEAFNGGWVNTDAIYADANRSTGFFTKLAKPVVGCVVVFPKGNGHNYGHVGIVTEVKDGKATKIIHCSPANGATTAIAENSAPAFAKNSATIYCWYDGIAKDATKPTLSARKRKASPRRMVAA